MNPVDPTGRTGHVRLLADRIFQLPAVAPPALFDAISFEDTEAALARLLGGYLPASVTRPVVADRRGGPTPEPSRSGDPRPVRFGSPHPNRTGRPPAETPPVPLDETPPVLREETSPALPGEPRPVLPGIGAPPNAAPPATSEHPQWTDRSMSTGVTRLERGAAALSAVLRAAAESNIGTAKQESTEDPRSEHSAELAPVMDDTEPSAILPELDRHSNEPAVLPASPYVSGDSWPDPDGEHAANALADVVLRRLGDQLELEFHRAYGPGEW